MPIGRVVLINGSVVLMVVRHYAHGACGTDGHEALCPWVCGTDGREALRPLRAAVNTKQSPLSEYRRLAAAAPSLPLLPLSQPPTEKEGRMCEERGQHRRTAASRSCCLQAAGVREMGVPS